jgi:hypothetical protein
VDGFSVGPRVTGLLVGVLVGALVGVLVGAFLRIKKNTAKRIYKTRGIRKQQR